MIDYIIHADPESGQIYIESSAIIDGSVVVCIPEEDKLRRRFISLYLHKADVEEGLDFLHCVSQDNCYRINQSLFISALVDMMKCFQDSESCAALNEASFSKFAPDEYSKYEKYKNWRNKHFIHDINSMREAIAFLIVAPEQSTEVFGGPPSVVWNRSRIDYVQESQSLEKLMQKLWQYVCKQFDAAGSAIIEKYKNKTREELLSYGEPIMRDASMDNPDKIRSSNQMRSID